MIRFISISVSLSAIGTLLMSNAFAQIPAPPNPEEVLQECNRMHLTGRVAKPEEIAALFAFLASGDAAFATGHVYVMDGAETTGGLCSQWAHE